jgi:DNA uptake protein ComE-like DNA-binding protein
MVIVVMFLGPMAINFFAETFFGGTSGASIAETLGVLSPFAATFALPLNTATDEDIMSIPGAGRRMTREFKEYRPWKTKEQFDREIGKYVGAKETARLWRYVVIQ